MSQEQKGRVNTNENVKRRRKKAYRACSHCQKVYIYKKAISNKIAL